MSKYPFSYEEHNGEWYLTQDSHDFTSIMSRKTKGPIATGVRRSDAERILRSMADELARDAQQKETR